MKKIESVYREILYKTIEGKKHTFTQSDISKKLNLSLSIINSAVKKLESMGAVKINLRNFKVLDAKKILYFWASLRNLEKDILFKTRINLSVKEIEKIMPNILFTAYTSYKFKFKDVPADYSEVYIYADDREIEIIKKRIAKLNISKNNPENLFILKKDSNLRLYGDIPLAQIFVDLWNLKQWYAKEFLESLEKKLNI